MKKTLLVLSSSLLVILAGLLLYTELIAPGVRRLTEPVDVIVPKSVLGWQVKEVPLAQTDGMMKVVNETLKFDGVVQRMFEKPGMAVLVYAAYWTPGKTTAFDAGTHNPDSCWCGIGWKQLERKNAVTGSIGGRALLPYEYGVYELGERRTPVMFWHLINGVPNSYEGQKLGWTSGWAGKFERWDFVVKDLKTYGLNQKQEQVFIRISIWGKPISEAFDDDDVIRLMHAIEGLGIYKDRPWR